MDDRPARVATLMRSRFVALAPSDSLFEAESLMRIGRLRSLPVVSAGVLAGMLSYVPLLLWCLSEPEGATASIEQRLREVQVRSLMDANPEVGDPGAPLEAAAATLVASGEGCLPIVDASDGVPRLVGLLTEADMLRAAYGPTAGPGSRPA